MFEWTDLLIVLYLFFVWVITIILIFFIIIFVIKCCQCCCKSSKPGLCWRIHFLLSDDSPPNESISIPNYIEWDHTLHTKNKFRIFPKASKNYLKYVCLENSHKVKQTLSIFFLFFLLLRFFSLHECPFSCFFIT